MGETKKKREFPNTYVIIFFIILICAIATWFVPGGEYVKVTPDNLQEVLYSGGAGWFSVA